MTTGLFEYAPEGNLSEGELAAIRTTCLDYIESWYEGDPDRMRASLHPELAKHTLVRRMVDTKQEGFGLASHTSDSLIEMTASAELQPADNRRADVTILGATHYLASAEVVSEEMIDLLHLVRMPEGWRIIHALWCLHGGVVMAKSGDN